LDSLIILVKKKVVTKDSAKIEGADLFGFEANHQNLQRFISADDPDYKKLVHYIRRYIEQAAILSKDNIPGNISNAERAKCVFCLLVADSHYC
jgi:hypothetical protein